MNSQDFAFLKSVRFWKLVLAVVVATLGAYEIIPIEISTAFATLMGIDITIRTVDRLGEKIGNNKTES